MKENVDDVLIRRKIIEESKLPLLSIKLYMGHSYSQLQTYIRGCQYVFNTCPTTYRKDSNRVLYRIGSLKENSVTTWYRREEKLGRLPIMVV